MLCAKSWRALVSPRELGWASGCFAAQQNSASAAREFTDGPSHMQVNTQEGACHAQGGPRAGAGAALVKKLLNKTWSYASTHGSQGHWPEAFFLAISN